MPDYSAITSVVSFGPVVLAVIAVCTAVAIVYVATRGGEWLLDVIRGSDGEASEQPFEHPDEFYEWDAESGEWIERGGDE